MTFITDNISLLKSKKFIILYGAGYWGNIFQTILKQEGIDITCYVVSDGQMVPSFVNGKEVKFLSSIAYKPNDTVFILTLNQKYRPEIQQKLNEKGYHCILSWNLQAIAKHFKKIFDTVMNNKKIHLKDDVIDFGILKINTPLSTQFEEIFWLEAADLILPYFNEYNFCNEGPYEIKNVEIKSNDKVIDCGANIGLFSTFAAQRNGEVFAFEPVPTTREYLQQNADLYPDKIHVEPYALSDKNGKTTMFITDSNGSSTLIHERVNELDQTTVPTITLDQFVHERNLARVDFIKADIEGAERLMLAGAQETLRRFAPKLAICTYHLPDDKEVLETLIKQANPDYIITHRWKKLYAYVPSEKRQQLLAQSVKEV